MRFPWNRKLWQGLALCAAFQPAFATAGTEPSTLVAFHWQLREVSDAQGQAQPGWSLLPAIPGAGTARAVLLDFTPDRVTVGRLCNALSASYQLEGHTLRIGPMIGTRRACPEAGVMALEQQVGQRLPAANAWRVESQGLPAPVLILAFADGGRWVLDGTPTDTNRYGGPGKRMFLEVGPERVACIHPPMPQHRCLQVRTLEYDDQGLKTRAGAWENWQGEIQGYAHQPGVRSVLRVLRYPNADAPADASAFIHVLDMTVESEMVR